jgi:4-hydroxy-4-methyl-2-oxoglutarate aldolase
MTGLMNDLGIVTRNIVRADKAAAEKLSRFGVATIHEAMGRVGLMYPYMRPIYAGAQACGAAVTALLQPRDNWMMHVVAEQLQPGDVVVAGLDMYKVREPLAAAGLGYID